MADDRNAPLTKGDLLEALSVVVTPIRQEIKHEIGQFRNEVEQEITELRTEINQLRAEMTEQIAQLRAEAQHQYDDLVEKIRASQTDTLKAFYSMPRPPISSSRTVLRRMPAFGSEWPSSNPAYSKSKDGS